MEQIVTEETEVKAANIAVVEDAPQTQATPSAGVSLGSVELTQGSNGGFYVSPEEYALIQQAKEDKISNGLEAKAKLHGKIMPSRRITVALRRIDLRTVAPDHDVVAYIEVCNLKVVSGQKAEATEEEMTAYLLLYRQGVDPTLTGIQELVGKA